MRLATALLVAAGTTLTLAPSVASAQTYSLTSSSAYTQNFNNLPSASTTSVTGGYLNNVNASLAGWYFAETGTGANTTLTAGTGSGTAGDTYSLGAAANSERALGSLRSGSVAPVYGFYFTNNTGATITSLAISYQGEVWRVGATGRADRLDFAYSTDATSLSTGTWTNLDALDYSSTSAAATASASMIQSAAISSSIGSLSIANGSTFFIRWTDADISGSDDAMGIDDFSLTATLQALVFGNYWAPGASGGGSGTWSSSSSVWSETSGTQGTASQATSGALLFAGTGGTVTVSGTVSTNAGLTFSADAYTVTGGTQVTLGGADATANTITVNSGLTTTFNSTLSAANGLTKAGNGSLVLGGSNTLGAVTVSAGTLKLTNASALGSTASGTTVASGATLDLNAQTVGAEAIALSGTLANSSATAASLSGLVTASGTAAISTTGGLTLSGGTDGTGSLTKSGNGTLTLTGATGHTGGTTVSAGALATSGAGTLTGDVTLASGTTLTLAGTTTLGTLSAANSTLSLAFNASAPSLATSTLNLDGTLGLSLTGLGLSPTAGTYQVLSFGSLTGSGSISFDQVLAGYSLVGTLNADNYSVAITLLAKSLTWSGDNGATWSVGGGNFTNDSTAAADTFGDGDAITFASVGTGGQVVVGAGVTFGSLTFTSPNLNYTFTGEGLAGAGDITLNGGGTVTFANANTFTGAIQVNYGSLEAANDSALGSTAGGTTIGASAQLFLKGGVTIAGEALSLGGTLLGSGDTNTYGGAITLTEDAAISSLGTLNVTGAISGAGHTLDVYGDGAVNLSGGLTAGALTKSGGGALTLSAASTLGATTLTSGTINLNHATALGNGTLTINGGALGNTSGAAKTLANAVSVGGDFDLGTDTSDASLTLSGAVDLGGASRTVRVVGSNTLSGALTNGSLVKTGGGTLILSGSNTLSAISIDSGTLRIGDAGTDVFHGDRERVVTVATGATFELNGQNATLTSLSGSGTVSNGGATNSTLTLNAGSATTLSTSLADGVGGGKLGLTKTGNGALTLASSNSNSGAIAIQSGSIVATAAGALGTGAVTLSAGASLIAGNTASVSNAITVNAPAAGGFIISEYVEGSSNNKYIELYNGTGAAIDLSQYQIRLYDNGKNAAAAAAGVVISTLTPGLSQLASGSTLVLRNPSAPTANTPGITTYSSTGITFFNGDDTFALETVGGVAVDIFGVIGNDPGTAWTAANGNTTLDRTLVRNADVLAGVSTNPAGTGPTGFATLGTQWTQSAQDTFSGLGSHTMNVPVSNAGPTVLGVTQVDDSVNFTGAVTLNGSANFTAAAGAVASFDGNISGAGAITKVGAGTVFLSGTNTFAGGLTVSEGTLQAGSFGALGAGVVSLAGGTLDLGGYDVAGTISLDGGALAGTGGLTSAATLLVNSGATLTFGGLSTFGSANLTLSGGTIDLGDLNPTNVITYVSGSFLNADAWSGTVAASGTGDVTSSIASLASAGLTVQLQSGQSANLAGVAANIVLNGATVSGLGSFAGNLAVASGTVDLAGIPAFLGELEVRGGTVSFGSDVSDLAITYRGGSITGSNYTGTVTIASGTTLDLSSGSITGSATVRTTDGANVTVGGAANAVVYAGGDVYGLDTFTGTLTVDGAKLVENGLINTSVTLASGGALGGDTQINGNLIQESGSILAPGNSPGISIVGGNQTLAGGASLALEVLNLVNPVAGTDYDTVNVLGALNLGALDTFNRYIIQLTSIDGVNANATAAGFLADQTFQLVVFTFGTLDLGANSSLVDLFDIQTTTANFAFLGEDGVTPVDAARFSLSQVDNTIVLTYTPIPEPSTYGLMLGGLALAGAAIRRRKAKAAAAKASESAA